MRLDAYMAEYWPKYSRAQWQKYIVAGYVSVNGKVDTSSKRLLGEDDEVQVRIPPNAHATGTIELPILYQDADVIVINKPAGILTHSKGPVLDEKTVADFVRSYTTDGLDTNRPGIVHRLDRATSGVLIAARTTEAKHFLQKQFQDRKAKKTYLAIVHGIPKEHTAIIKLPLERNPAKPQTFRVGAGGKYAETSYKVIAIASDRHYSLVELRPLTGRTHQLRVHLAYINSPIVGDSLYQSQRISEASRLMLHASQLEITLPHHGRVTFTASLPDDFRSFLQAHGISYEA